MNDYFCQNNLKVVEDHRCSYLKDYNGYLRKSSLLPIKAPGNLCGAEFSWASGSDDCKKSKIDIGGKIFFDGPLAFTAELLDSCGTPPFQWTLFSEDEQEVISNVTMDKFVYNDLPFGKYTLHVSDKLSKNTESFTVLQKISNAFLYCPRFTKVGFINELNVHVSDENGHWLDFHGLDQISGPVSFTWSGDGFRNDEGFSEQNTPFVNMTFPNRYSADLQLDVQVSVRSTLGTTTSQCRMKTSPDLQMIQVDFQSSIVAPAHDQEYQAIKDYIKTLLIKMLDDDKKLDELVNKYHFNFDSDIDILPVSHSLSGNLTLMYIYAHLSEDFTGDIEEFREDLIQGLIKAHNDNHLIIHSIYIAKDDGTLEPYETTGRAGMFLTSLIFILLIVALAVLGKRYILPRIKLFVRPHHIPVNGEDNDEEPIVEHDEIANVFGSQQ